MPDTLFRSTNGLPGLGALGADDISAMSQSAGEPGWLTEQRLAAWTFFAQALPPVWRRTDLTQLQPETIAPLSGIQGTSILADDAVTRQGVVMMPLLAATKSHEALVRQYLGKAIDPMSHKFSALRAALWQDGMLLYVPRGVEVAAPLRVTYQLADGSRAIFPYSLVILEAHAQLNLIEEYTSPDLDQPALAGPTTEIFVGPGSHIRYASVQTWGQGIHHLGSQMIVLDRDAAGEWVSLSLGGKVQHIEAESRMQGDGSAINWLGATFANQQQHLLTAPWLRHIGSNTNSLMDFKTVVSGEGYSVFDGMIKIEHESRATSTRLEEHAIHLTPKARSDSIPGLKIDTNDVAKAGHASTSGQIEDEHLFYMQSRGMSQEEARRLIVMGFFDPALQALPADDLRERLTALIEAKI
ncbi:MAG: Fe-S cluster assembly protein SufD [Chloroflexaceae bacterium]|nr:Fe-S cluster assembly protein SufD [Chloroflexaceae bacterium]